MNDKARKVIGILIRLVLAFIATMLLLFFIFSIVTGGPAVRTMLDYLLRFGKLIESFAGKILGY